MKLRYILLLPLTLVAALFTGSIFRSRSRTDDLRSKAEDLRDKAEDWRSKTADDWRSKADDLRSKADDLRSKTADDWRSRAEDLRSKASGLDLPEVDIDLDDVNPLKYRRSLMGYYSFEDTSYTQQAIDTWMAEQDMPQPSKLRGGGGGMTALWGRFVLDTSGHGMGDTVSSGASEWSYGAGQGQLSIGVAMVKQSMLRIYPLVGVGGLGGGVGRKGSSGDGRRKRSASQGWGAALVTTGVGIDFTPGIWRFGLLFGLRIGYNYGLTSIHMGEGRNVHPPTGPFVRIVFGWGLR